MYFERGSSRSVLLLALVAASLLVIFWIIRESSESVGAPLSDEDQLARQDDYGQETAESPDMPELFPDTEIGRKLENHMTILALPAETIEEADSRYARSLAELRSDTPGAIDLIDQAYSEIQQDRYFDRWGLVKTLSDLSSDDAYQMLSSIAMAKPSSEKSQDLHHFSTIEEEIVIQIRAVEGLRVLASQGNREAERDLLAIAIDPEMERYAAIKTRAIKAYLAVGENPDERAKTLIARLPDRFHGIVTLDITDETTFRNNVAALTELSDEDTTSDAAEEKLPDTDAPTVEQDN